MPKLPAKKFAALLFKERKRLKLSQSAAAELCEVSPRVWWKWENAAGSTLAVTQEGVLSRLKQTPTP